ncbi:MULTISPECIES: AbrB/MazE/SpoVT family DNA-binding domain-containing protein [Paenibacillus]|uniref:AbrB/MazE/SpoVT family DNA-binding domain-containing protein n=1 Tax=Paenibacillus TaxID=44249 RepID=UPI00096E56AC|nr:MULTISPECIES: AbrB/MazE/SpoVT family DNA-binding domain-containing protein [Paenibacillus]MDH6430252.1 transcriptional pleiotropic regulator of transition state genes [Paenibacillus sp. PastH-4]MDH6446467.1 transcriptional pleiotropic regulator of transition state genes [Paenibacillus sp. PastF-4]MDH6530067.1 transcriptional pleiotropic regulator of transition state genes [Paenibacillus sp. PastH-3]OMD10041.1 AbrB family transcriptional regulator [Paenibacillus odorifer]
MKATGIVRQLDGLGRIVIPMELRRTMNIKDGDGLEIFVEGEKIVLRKYAPGCTLCGSLEGIEYFSGKPICHTCISKITKLQGLS